MMRSSYTGIPAGGKYVVPHYLALFVDLNRATIEVKLEGENDVLGVGDAINKKESEKLAALSAVYQLNALGKAGHFS
jgi:hypothetical protein